MTVTKKEWKAWVNLGQAFNKWREPSDLKDSTAAQGRRSFSSNGLQYSYVRFIRRIYYSNLKKGGKRSRVRSVTKALRQDLRRQRWWEYPFIPVQPPESTQFHSSVQQL